MPSWPSQSTAAMNAFYGNPDANGNGEADASWEAANLIYITPPYPMVLAWDTSRKVTRIRVHKKFAPTLLTCLEGIRDLFSSQAELERAGMHLFGGCYNFRLKRGGSTLSTHSWGCAIDLNPAVNAFGRKYNSRPGMMPLAVVNIFKAQGLDWGGLWRTGDAMHFQAAGSGSGQDLSALATSTVPETNLVRVIQQALADKGYPEVGLADGIMGSKTRGAILAFRTDNAMSLNTLATPELFADILASPGRDISITRVLGKPANSRIVSNSNAGMGTAAVVAAGGAISQAAPIVEQIEGGAGLVTRLKGALGPLVPFLVDLWPLLLVGGAVLLLYLFWRSKAARIEDFRTGKTAR